MLVCSLTTSGGFPCQEPTCTICPVDVARAAYFATCIIAAGQLHYLWVTWASPTVHMASLAMLGPVSFDDSA
jgi:hypothetical protein